ncbi:MAG: amidohydrolase family protein [Pyramidobacter sp.]|nr:amidohydrolase family protein [Pyramidobacter sp.]
MFDPNVDKPLFALPENACDAHFHIFGDPAKYVYEKVMRYAPPVATADDYDVFRRLTGFKRLVLVQPSCFGKDNTCQLDAAKQYGLENCRVIVDADDSIADSELEKLHAQGARGIRINVRPIEPLTAGLADSLLPRIRLWEKRCRDLGWSLDFLFPDWLTTEMIPHLDALRVPFTIAHMGMNKCCNGTESRGFQRLLDLVKNGEGYCWIKITAPYRISTDDEYRDVVPLARAVLEAAPNRAVWGSDYPHASFTQHNTVKIFNLIRDFAPEPELRQRLLADNPQELYGF